MRHLAIEVGSFRFVARMEQAAAPKTCAAFLELLPFSNQVIHSRWSGEAVWVPLGEFDTGLGFENHTSHPSRGDVLLYPGGFSEIEILFAYGSSCFASKMGQLAGNHFLTVVEGADQLYEMGRTVLWKGAQWIRFTDLGERWAAKSCLERTLERQHMKPTQALTLADVRRAAEAAEAEARANGWAVSIAICDAGGHALWLQRMDGAPLMSAAVAPEKARTCVLSGKPSKAFEDMVNNGRIAALAMPVVPLEGGEPIVVDGAVIGAVGVSGVKAGEDAQVARAGVTALLAFANA